MEKILEISKDVIINSECWTYYKFAVMQTSTFFDVWLTNHMELYIDQNGNAIFGNDGMMYPLSYYGDLLNIKEENLLDIPAEQVVGFLIKQINSGNYVILDLNYKRILFPDTDEFHLHETLVYGYDLENKEFIVPIIKNGAFRESRVSFEVLVKSYQECFNYYQKDSNRLFDRRLWFLGITIIKLKNDYDNANNTNFADYLYSDLELCNFDDLKDDLINHSEDLNSLLNYFSDVKDASADYYISDGMGGFKNIEVIDLSYFVEDYIYEK